jgi:peptide/nickel transport system permease protein
MKRFGARLIWSLITLLGTAVLTFLLTNALPGDVARVIAGPKASAEVLAEIHKRYHLEEPLWKRLGYHLVQIAQGDLGHSFVTDQPVSEAIRTHFPVTAALALLAVVIWMGIAIPLGVLTARWRNSWFDRSVLVAGTICLSLPAFWLARLLQYSLAYKVGWFPVAGFNGFAHLILPAFALAILAVGYYARLIHSSMVEVLGSPYIRAARAKGASEFTVLFHHALRNALIPVLTVLGTDLAAVLGGVLFVENVFALPGIGTLAVQSVFNLDPPMIMGTVLFTGFIVVTLNWIVDATYRFIDPRIRES